MVQTYSSDPKSTPKGQIGDRFGHWELIGFERCAKRNKLMYLCKCDCGTVRALQPGALFGCASTSCGCSRTLIPPAPPLPTVDFVEFRTLEQYPGYAFGSDGSVWGCRARAVGRERGTWTKVNGSKDKNGYLRVTITTRSSSKTLKIHVLILEAFTGPRPQGCVSRHLDGNQENNAIDNLVWGTPAENQRDSILHRTHAGLRKSGRGNPNARLSFSDVTEIMRLKHDIPCRDIAKRFDVTESAIRSIISGRTWSRLTGVDEEFQTMNQHVREWISSIMQSPIGLESIASALDELGYRLAEKCTGRDFDKPNETTQTCL